MEKKLAEVWLEEDLLGLPLAQMLVAEAAAGEVGGGRRLEGKKNKMLAL